MTDTLDRATMDRLLADLGGDRAALAEVVDLFAEEAPRLLSEAHEAATTREPMRFRRAVHTLKSSAASVGARTLADLARDAEASGDADALPSLDAEWLRVQRALEVTKSDLSGPL